MLDRTLYVLTNKTGIQYRLEFDFDFKERIIFYLWENITVHGYLNVMSKVISVKSITLSRPPKTKMVEDSPYEDNDLYLNSLLDRIRHGEILEPEVA
jgi:hypothetical protein